MRKMTQLQAFKFDIITNFIGWSTDDEITDEVRSILLTNAKTFVENEDSGFPISDAELNDLKALSNFVDEDSDLGRSMIKLLILIQDMPNENPNEGLVTYEYLDNQKSVKVRRATKDDQDGDCYNNVSQIFAQLMNEGVIGFDVEEGLKWK